MPHDRKKATNPKTEDRQEVLKRAREAALLDLRLTPTVYRPEFLDALEAAAGEAAGGVPVRVHVKLDTGMTRVGVAPADRDALLARLAASDRLDVEGVQTHLARADEPDVPTTTQQLDRFAEGLRAVAAVGLAPRLVHAVSHVRHVERGTPVSYGHRWSAPDDGWLATVPIGYADGVPRPLTGRLDVLHRGRRRPVVGTITMDQLLVWCGAEIPAVGDEIVLIGTQSAPEGGGSLRIGMEEWAERLGTITYEIATGISARVPRTRRSDRPGA
jgi:alanine racemase